MEDVVGKKVRLKSEDEIMNEILKGNPAGAATKLRPEDCAGKSFFITDYNPAEPDILYITYEENRKRSINYYWIKGTAIELPEHLFEIEE